MTDDGIRRFGDRIPHFAKYTRREEMRAVDHDGDVFALCLRGRLIDCGDRRWQLAARRP